MARESMDFDIVIVGGGPAGLSAAIRLAQLNQKNGTSLSICLLEKGATIGAHLLSGAVLDPTALNELIPDWKAKNAPVNTPVTEDEFIFLTDKKAMGLPLPKTLNNKGNYIISIDRLCIWLAEQAEQLGINIFPGFPAAKLLFNDTHDKIIGVQTKDMGIGKNGEQTDRFQPGINIFAKQTIFAEGCRGELSEQLMRHFNLRKDCQPQTYGIGIKELWKIKPEQHNQGEVVHTIGWPLDSETYGGSFIYHAEDNLLSIGFVIGLDYKNPYLDPFKIFQQFKTHPNVRELLEGGECIGYGARALVEGGYQCIPKLTFPGGVLVGDAAGFLNVARIKGNHNAMKSGMLAAEAIFAATDLTTEATSYESNLKASSIYKELYRARNIRPAFHYGMRVGLIYSWVDQNLLKGNAPWTLKYKKSDDQTLKSAKRYKPIDYPKPDGKISFDRMTQVYLSGTRHNENQPYHLQIKDVTAPIALNLKTYAFPEQRYCPAGVYELIEQDGTQKLQLNAANCVHCKTCDIKDPSQNIIWTTPEGGDGPNYHNM